MADIRMSNNVILNENKPDSYEEDEYIVATDGSCLEKSVGPMGWAWVDYNESHNCGGYTHGTNQIAELTAVLMALRDFKDKEKLVIEADSQYALFASTKWLPNWKRNNWRTYNNKPVKNIEIIKAIDKELQERKGRVRFVWVRGHAGHELNEMADDFAQRTSRYYKKVLEDESFAGLDINDKSVNIPNESKFACMKAQEKSAAANCGAGSSPVSFNDNASDHGMLF